MSQISIVLLAIATELSKLAKNSLPALQEGETVQREWLKNETFYRETNLNGQSFIAKFDFLQRKSQRVLVKGGNAND